MDKECIFCKIISHEIPAKIEFEDEDMVVIRDINPQAKIHLLIIPKKHFLNLIDVAEEDVFLIARCIIKFSSIYKNFGLESGFRTVCNSGYNACQSVGHMHIHILGGERLSENMG